jgi:hypothetical protein
MPEYQSDPVTQRLDRLERENWYWKRATLLLLIVIGAAILMGQATKPHLIEAEEIYAQKFFVKDDKGMVRAALKYDVQANPGIGGVVTFELYGKNTPTRAVLAVGDGNVLFELRATNTLNDAWAREEAELSQKIRSRAITLEEIERRQRARVAQFDVTLTHERGSTYSLKNTQGSVGTFVGRDYLGRDLSYMKVEDGNGASAILGRVDLKKTVTGSVEQRPASSLVLFNKDNNVIWQAP